MEQQKVKRFQSEAGNLIFGGYLFCSTRPNKNRNFDTMRITVAPLSFCQKALFLRRFWLLSVPAVATKRKPAASPVRKGAG